jgi:hypothetical protein
MTRSNTAALPATFVVALLVVFAVDAERVEVEPMIRAYGAKL